ncbi:uncharacterized membrane protein YidH (DUF202 family) [Paenibacillus sp. DS2015]
MNYIQKGSLPLRTSLFRVRFAAILLAVAGLLFAIYPFLRPFSDEVSLQGATAFASVEWLVSHLIAMLAFILLTFGLYGVYVVLQETNVERIAFRGLILSWLGTALTLPFYGAEVFGLQVIGQEAVKLQTVELLKLANQIRTGPGFFIIIVGLMLLGLGLVMMASALWKSRLFPKWVGVPLAVGFLMYLPQYAATQPLRVAHGLLITAGCLWMAVCIIKHVNRGWNK